MKNRIENSTTIVQEDMAKPQDTLLIDALIEEEQTLDNSYIGRVVDNNDPDKIGRCKIRVFGIFDEVSDEDLPWAIGEQGFVGSVVGSFIVPPVGCTVSVNFENGDLYFPKYSRKVIDSSRLPKNATKNYPDTMVFFETDNGTAFEIDRSNDEVTFVHKSGLKVKFVIDGDSGKITGKMEDLDLKINGKTTIEAEAVNVTNNGKTDISLKDDFNMKVTGLSRVEAETVMITHHGITNINATSVNVKHSGLWIDNGSAVIPSGKGPYCALPTCPYSGMPLQGSIIVGGQ